MLTRRQFLGNSSVLALSSLLNPRMSFASHGHHLDKIGVQLYTVRDQMKADFEGTLAKIAAIGFKEVEFAGYYDRTSQQVRAILQKNGLTSPAAHIQYGDIADDLKLKAQIKFAKEIGHKYLIHPWIPEELRKTLDDWKKAARLFNHIGKLAKDEGIEFGYHNHWFEFQPVEGKLPYDLLLEECDALNVVMELDLAWISSTGTDPVKYFEKYKGRFPLVHVKELSHLPKADERDASKFQTSVGKGILDWKRILSRAHSAGVKHFFVEEDDPKDALESVRASYLYLKDLRY